MKDSKEDWTLKTNPHGDEELQPCCSVGTGRPVTALELLLVVVYQSDPVPGVVVPNCPEVARITRDWIERGYLRECGAVYHATDALRVWMDTLTQVPRPKQVTKWVNFGG